jgi:hypothetical protein
MGNVGGKWNRLGEKGPHYVENKGGIDLKKYVHRLRKSNTRKVIVMTQNGDSFDFLETILPPKNESKALYGFYDLKNIFAIKFGDKIDLFLLILLLVFA